MTIADGLKKTLYRARALSGRFGIRPYNVFFVKRAYTGEHTGDGARLEDWTAITHADGQPVNVRFTKLEERALAQLPDGAIEVGPITPPPFSNIRELLESLTTGQTAHLRVVGGIHPDGALYRIVGHEQPSVFRVMLRAVPVANQ